MKKILLILIFPGILFSQDFFIGSYPSNVEGGEGAIINPSAMVDLEGFQVFTSINGFYEKSNINNYKSFENKTFFPALGFSYNLTEDIALGISQSPLIINKSKYSKEVPFKDYLRKFELEEEEIKLSLGIRAMKNLNVGFSVREISTEFSFSKNETSPEINGNSHEVNGSYRGDKRDLSFEISSLYKFKDYNFAFIFRPEKKVSFGYGDFFVNFEPEEEIPEEVYKTLKTYYPSGGVKVNSLIPQEIIFSLTKKLNKNMETSFGLHWTKWSSWNGLNIDYKNETVNPSTNEDVLKDQELNLKYKDSFKLKALFSYLFSYDIKGYFEVVLRNEIVKKPIFAGFEGGAGIDLTIGASYPFKYGDFMGKFFGYYTFSYYEKNSNFDYRKNLLGVGISFSF